MHRRRLHPASRWSAVAAALIAAAAVPAQQQIRFGFVAGPGLPRTAEGSGQNGPPVEMFENPNLDRYLRRAQEFLGREDYAAAIQVLQDVIEGRTVEVLGGEAPPPAGEDGEAEAPAPERDRARTRGELDARRAVFSADGRLYRPVRRLCHEMLARLPDVGIELYRANHEVAAAELLAEALDDGSSTALEAVANRWFVTLAAGRAMLVLADRWMHEGRYRAAVQVLRDLLDVYPPSNRARLGIDDVWCGFKAALSLRLAGEVSAARAAAVELAQRHPDATLRIAGELQAVADLPDSELFAGATVGVTAPKAPAPGISCIDGTTQELVPLWQYRFADPHPYREPKAASEQRGGWVVHEALQRTAMPHAGRYGPATWVAFASPPAGAGAPGEARVLFLEHYRLRLGAAESGLILAEGDGPVAPPQPRDDQPRVRIAASDFALLRPVVDEQRVYAVLGSERPPRGVETLKDSELVAYDRVTWQRVWSSEQWKEDEDLRDVTFLAAPTVFGERLLLPALRRDVYELRCHDRNTGQPLWSVPLHSGGSAFWKAPGAPVAVRGSTAYVLTNAGCVAAVDAFTGDLRWIRRYERSDPLRESASATRSANAEMVRFGFEFPQADLPTFLPNDLVVADGLVILAAVDSDMLLGLDSASGEPVWMVDGTTRYAPYGRLRELVGATADALYFVADRALVCIELVGGLVRWSRELPAVANRKSPGRGRGTIVGDQVLVPGDREILVVDAAGRQPLRRLALPSFDPSRDPLTGTFHLTAHGPLLAVGYEGGIEMLSSAEALVATAATARDAARRAELLRHAGRADAAEQVLATELREAELDAGRRDRLGRQLLQLVRARALRLARDGQLEPALAELDEIAALFIERTTQLAWHLARLDACREAGDLHAHEREQQRLYDLMEGRTGARR